jgi:hypothetical protein
MTMIEDLLVTVAVLIISGASAVGLGHVFLSFVIRDRRPS